MEKNDYIFGTRAVLEALEAGKTIDKIYIKRDAGGDIIKELTERAKYYDVPVQRVPLEKLNRITLKNHQGCIAILSPVTYYKLENLIPQLFEEGKNPFCVILDNVTDTRNFGAIARTAECAGANFIVIGEKNSVSVTSDAVKASAGALFHLPVCREKNIAEAVRILQSSGYKVFGASEKSSEDYTKADFKSPVAIVMGAEDKGISYDVLRLCDDLVAIPIKGNIGSLNVSVAAGVIMYEIVRQRKDI